MAHRKSVHGILAKRPPLLDFPPPPLGHSSPGLCPPHCPRQEERDPLGPPLSIRAVAALIGCSVWTVRQKYLPLGLPHFRLSPAGKLFFYKTQVTAWLLARQKGVK